MTATNDNNNSNRMLLDYVYPNIISIVTHPFAHARTLIQLGHEPDPPILQHSVLSKIGIGQKKYYYPSVFAYCGSVTEEVGVWGLCTIGLPARLISSTVGLIVTDSILKKFNKGVVKPQHVDTEGDFSEFVNQTLELTVARVGGVIISYPFQVIMIRQMAQLVGGETAYSNIFSGIHEIWSNEGIRGFFGGMWPKITGEIISIWITAGLAYMANKYILADKVAPDVKQYTPYITSMLAASRTYKYNVVATNMAVSGSNLKVAIPFPSSSRCHEYLYKLNGLNRGASLFFRVTHGPY